MDLVQALWGSTSQTAGEGPLSHDRDDSYRDIVGRRSPVKGQTRIVTYVGTDKDTGGTGRHQETRADSTPEFPLLMEIIPWGFSSSHRHSRNIPLDPSSSHRHTRIIPRDPSSFHRHSRNIPHDPSFSNRHTRIIPRDPSSSHRTARSSHGIPRALRIPHASKPGWQLLSPYTDLTCPKRPRTMPASSEHTFTLTSLVDAGQLEAYKAYKKNRPPGGLCDVDIMEPVDVGWFHRFQENYMELFDSVGN
ncbi:hypothetical protein Ddye_009664 [Dipteronia dyeriana]|uniref:Uncharacterized protein n=1 Tax=Dipteronia dyeriana TaxID=168575 RepID=A0AAD9XC79_9ROSI|nr:hypothetical protein Ddye_009664 [Dipteronia dyeriana]